MDKETLRNEWEKENNEEVKQIEDTDIGFEWEYYNDRYVEHLESLILKLMDEKECPKEKCMIKRLGYSDCEMCSRNYIDQFTPKDGIK